MRGDTVALQASAWPVLDVLLSAWTHGDVREEGRCPAGGLVACFKGGQETGKPLAAAQQLRSSEELLYRGPPGEPNVLALQSDTRVPRAFLDRLQLIKQDRRRKSSRSIWIVVATLVRGQKGTASNPLSQVQQKQSYLSQACVHCILCRIKKHRIDKDRKKLFLP